MEANEDQRRRDVEGNPITGRGVLLLFTDDLDVLYMPADEVEARGRELGSWLYSNCPETFSDAVVSGYHDAGRERITVPSVEEEDDDGSS